MFTEHSSKCEIFYVIWTSEFWYYFLQGVSNTIHLKIWLDIILSTYKISMCPVHVYKRALGIANILGCPVGSTAEVP